MRSRVILRYGETSAQGFPANLGGTTERCMPFVPYFGDERHFFIPKTNLTFNEEESLLMKEKLNALLREGREKILSP